MHNICLMEYAWIFFGLFIYLANCQDRIIFRDENEDDLSFVGNPVPVVNTIPESLLIRMKDIRNPAQFLSQFVARSDEPENSNVTGRRALAGVTAAAIAQPANCQTEQKIVELEKPHDGSTLLWPNCVRVRRCGGCCTSKRLTCNAVATSILNVTVLELRYSPQNPETFESRGTRLFSLEQHDRCSCSCKERPEDCTPDIHIYNRNECRCVCSNQEQAERCTSPKKVWDNQECLCKCRRIQQCSSGRYFNILRCRCEVMRLSLASDFLDRSNSTLRT